MKQLIFILTIISLTSSAQTPLNFSFGGQNRTANIHLPINYNAANKYPVVLILHGLTQTGTGIQSYSKFNDVADTANFIAVYPDGINTAWNANIGATGIDDATYLNILLDSVIGKYNVNTNRLYSCGLSNGGYMSHRLACEYANRFAAIASVAGTMFDGTFNGCNPTRAVPVLQIHGTADLVVPYTGSATAGKGAEDVINFWVAKNTCNTMPLITNLPNTNTTDGSSVIDNVYNGCQGNTICELLKIQGGGHTWPDAVGISGIGNVNKDINASATIWNFFNKFSLPNSLINQPTISKLTILPNPATNSILLTNLFWDEVCIINFQGKKTWFTNTGNSINLNSFTTGFYCVQAYKNKILQAQNKLVVH